MNKFRIFISSVQKEFAHERRALRDYIEGDALLRRFFTVFLFEDLPASGRRADQVYLAEVDRCDVYLALIGQEYGNEDADGLSPTEGEFDRATASGKERLVFVKGTNDRTRDPKMRDLLRKAGAQLIRRRFTAISDLTPAVFASLVDFLENRGAIQNRPFDDRPCPGATLDDIDGQAIADFVHHARSERRFPLPERTPMADVLAHLHLMAAQQPTHAALLLFGRNPQQFVPCAEVRCMHFHGTEVQRPAPSYQIFKGRLFEQVDRAADFVLSVLNRTVGTRTQSSQAPVAYEIPPDVVREAIVNAIVHRDYTSAGAVQVSVFADRIEVWNPGVLPPPLTPERLRHPHGSVARNARLCEALFLTRYVEKYGTGTLMMIRESVEHALPEPDFEQRAGEFVVTIWRDWLTESVLKTFDLNDRQSRAIGQLKAAGRITSREYQDLTGTTPRTTTRDLDDLVRKKLLQKVGKVGRGAHYILRGKPDKNRTNQPAGVESDRNRTNRPRDRAPRGSKAKPSKK